MAWNPAAIVAAAGRAGMLCPAVYLPAGAAVAFECSILQPDVLVLDDQRQVADVEIEYPTAALPAQVRRGDELQVTDHAGVTTTYRAMAHARRAGTGWFSRVELTRASAP